MHCVNTRFFLIHCTLEFPNCKRNIDIETHEHEENIQFIQEQCDNMKSKEGMHVTMYVSNSHYYMYLFNEKFLFAFE